MKKENLLLVFLALYLLVGCIKDVPPRPPKEQDENGNLNQVDCSDARYDDWETSNYVLPYPVGKSYAINLSHCGGSYHSVGRADQYAIDFAMNIGSAITASDSGKVVFVEESGYDGEFPNNKVVIQHSNGTYAQYMHLTYNGASVSVGERVEKGARIGLSGSTGLAGYPHLHFVATKSGSWEYPYVSFPTTFSNTTANPRSLEEGKIYKAQPF